MSLLSLASTLSIVLFSVAARADALLQWNGDIRIRSQTEQLAGTELRPSQKLRLRFGPDIQVDPELRVQLRLATARNARNQDQTLGESSDPGMPRRFIGIDLAYADWRPLSFAQITFGRLPQIHDRPGQSQILLDEEIALEGVGIRLESNVSDSISIFGLGGATWIRENYDTYYSEKQLDSALNFGQAGVKWNSSEFRAEIGMGFFNFVGVQGRLFSELSTVGKSFGNTEDPTGVVKNRYQPIQTFASAEKDFNNWTFGIFVEKINNRDVGDQSHASDYGINMRHGDLDGAISVIQVEADAVPGIFTDSDFAAGNTDSDGFKINLGCVVAKNMKISSSYIGSHLTVSQTSAWYARTYLDLIASF